MIGLRCEWYPAQIFEGETPRGTSHDPDKVTVRVRVTTVSARPERDLGLLMMTGAQKLSS